MPVKTVSKRKPSATATLMAGARGIVNSDPVVTESGFSTLCRCKRLKKNCVTQAPVMRGPRTARAT